MTHPVHGQAPAVLRIGMVAGELSGDRLGASLIEEIKARCAHNEISSVEFEGIAGPAMRAAGCRVIARTEQLSVMGFTEVLSKIPHLLGIRKRVLRNFLDNPPDIFIGIDSPDFNLGLERSLKNAGIDVVHWVSPSVWAWRAYRIRKIRKCVNLMLTLFPFEAAFYSRQQVPVQCTGHPLADEIPDVSNKVEARSKTGLKANVTCVALLPGSRQSEVGELLSVFLKTAEQCVRKISPLQFVLPVAEPMLRSYCHSLVQGFPALDITVLDGQSREAMQAADIVLLASGTATLECMLVKRPMVVAYRMRAFSYWLAKKLLVVPFVSLPNNLLGRRQVPEYIQENATADNLSREVIGLLQDTDKAARQVEPFAEMHVQLRQGAAGRVADIILNRAQHD